VLIVPAPQPARPAPADDHPQHPDEDPFAGIGAGSAPISDPLSPDNALEDIGKGESILDRRKELRHYRRPLGWRFFVTVGGGVVGCWLSGVTVISWGLGAQAFLASLAGSVGGALCIGLIGAFCGLVAWLRLSQASVILGQGRLPIRYFVAYVLAGFLIFAPIGTLVGAAGAMPKAAQVQVKNEPGRGDTRIYRAIGAAAGGAVLGALPGLVLSLVFRRKPVEDKKEPGKRSGKSRR
jgi:hypothetical protein